MNSSPTILGYGITYTNHARARYRTRIDKKAKKPDTVNKRIDALITRGPVTITTSRPDWLGPASPMDARKASYWLSIDDRIAIPIQFCDGPKPHFEAITLMVRERSPMETIERDARIENAS